MTQVQVQGQRSWIRCQVTSICPLLACFPELQKSPSFSHSNMCSPNLGDSRLLCSWLGLLQSLISTHPANQTPESRPLCHSYLVDRREGPNFLS